MSFSTPPPAVPPAVSGEFEGHASQASSDAAALLNRLSSEEGNDTSPGPEEILQAARILPPQDGLKSRLLQAAMRVYSEHLGVGSEWLETVKDKAVTEEAVDWTLQLAELPIGMELDCFRISEMLGKAGRIEEAVAFLQRAVQAHPKAVFLHHNLGINLRKLERSEEALAAFRNAIALRPYSDASLTMAGSTLKDLGRLPEALEFHGAAVRINPSSSLALYNLGNTLQKQEEFTAAIKAYEQALALRPDWPDLLTNLCTVLERTDLYRRALPHLLQLVKLTNNAPANLARLVCALREVHQPAKALELTEVLIKDYPDNLEYRRLKAACLPRLGRSREAVEEYRKIIARDSNDIGAYRSLIYIANYLPYEDPKELFNFYRK